MAHRFCKAQDVQSGNTIVAPNTNEKCTVNSVALGENLVGLVVTYSTTGTERTIIVDRDTEIFVYDDEYRRLIDSGVRTPEVVDRIASLHDSRS